jgi:hypothetical protein
MTKFTTLTIFLLLTTSFLVLADNTQKENELSEWSQLTMAINQLKGEYKSEESGEASSSLFGTDDSKLNRFIKAIKDLSDIDWNEEANNMVKNGKLAYEKIRSKGKKAIDQFLNKEREILLENIQLPFGMRL